MQTHKRNNALISEDNKNGVNQNFYYETHKRNNPLISEIQQE